MTNYSPKGYPASTREHCLKMYVNGAGFRAIERITGINHNTIIRWVKKVAIELPLAPVHQEIPEITEIDELYEFR
nr:IS1-like element transposase [Anaplasma marginale]